MITFALRFLPNLSKIGDASFICHNLYISEAENSYFNRMLQITNIRPLNYSLSAQLLNVDFSTTERNSNAQSKILPAITVGPVILENATMRLVVSDIKINCFLIVATPRLRSN